MSNIWLYTRLNKPTVSIYTKKALQEAGVQSHRIFTDIDSGSHTERERHHLLRLKV
ncbi:MAG: hypothetical protein U0X71_07260 [Sphingobacteriaceae bacterium]